jgi:D-psicose/D-tagatose/L-ribulose 3-epimerase
MQISTHNWMRPEPIRRSIERMAQLGIEYIELAGEPDWYSSAEVGALLKEYKRKCWGTVTLTLGERNLCAKDAGQRERTVAFMKKVVTMSKELGGEVTTVVPVTVGKISADSTPELEWQWLVEGMKELYVHSEKEGIKLAIEPLNRFETYLINRGDQALKLANEVGPNCGVCLDVFHMNMEETNLYEPFKQVGSKVYNVHVADNNRFACGMGQLDFVKIMATIKSIGYKGCVSLEFMPTIDRTPVSRWGPQIELDTTKVPPELLQFIIDHGSNLLSEEFYTSMFKKSMTTLQPLL